MLIEWSSWPGPSCAPVWKDYFLKQYMYEEKQRFTVQDIALPRKRFLFLSLFWRIKPLEGLVSFHCKQWTVQVIMSWAWLCRAANTGQHFAWRGLQHDELLDSTWLAIACLGRLSASWFLSLRCVHEKKSTFLIFQCPRFSNGSSAVIALARTWQSTKNEQDGTCRTVMAEIPFTEPWLLHVGVKLRLLPASGYIILQF